MRQKYITERDPNFNSLRATVIAYFTLLTPAIAAESLTKQNFPSGLYLHKFAILH